MLRVIKGLACVCTVVVAVLAFTGSAFAEGEGIGGTLIAVTGDERVPVEGVRIAVSQDGSVIGEGTSDADGVWSVLVPGPGAYTVELDTTTLPEDVSLTDPDRSTLDDIVVQQGRQRTVLFPLGESTAGSSPAYQRAGALFFAGLKLGAVIALSAVGLSLIYAVTRLVNFAHGEMVTIGAVLAYFFSTSVAGPGWSLVVAGLVAVLLGAGFGLVQDRGMWRPLRKRRMGVVSMMVVSIGLSFALRYLILVIFGGTRRFYDEFTGQSPIDILGIPVVPKNLATIVVGVVVLGLVGLFLQKTRTGTALRAVSDNPDLSESSGIDVDRVVTLTWTMAGGLAALGGVFFGLTEAVQWDMGFRLLLLIFAAVVLGGLGTAYGAMLGAFVVGIAVEMSTLFFPSELKAAVGLIILIIMLLIKPQGLLGTRERVG
ncbi:MAG: branched-chain amino acid ABC transporter permease [Acidimicrobiia bacterium]